MQTVATTEGSATVETGGNDGVAKTPAPKDRRGANKAKKMASGIDYNKKHGYRLFALVAPFLIMVVLFSYLPLFGWIYAFFDYQPPLPLSECDFVGLQWFKLLVTNPAQLQTIGQVLINTFAMSGLNILTSFIPVIFAIALNEIRARWFKNLVQTLTTLPNFISWVLVYSIAFAMFSSSGMINELLQNLHLISSPIKFLDSGDHTWLKMLLWSMWKGVGWGSIMYLAGIAGIDPELYEAAQVDGANRFQQIIHVTIPQLLPTYFVLLMLSISNFLNNGMDQYYVFQNSFNQKWIQVLDLYVYNVGLGQSSLSLGTAISMLKSLVSVALLFIVNSLSKRLRGVGIV
jgi:putative aldouronate transport system permease protein